MALDLWKFLHIGQVQAVHNVEGSVVDEIAPMAPATVDRMGKGDSQKDLPSIVELINVYFYIILFYFLFLFLIVHFVENRISSRMLIGPHPRRHCSLFHQIM